MKILPFIKVLATEFVSSNQFTRVPEPMALMEDADQVAEYDEQGDADGVLASLYLTFLKRAAPLIRPGATVVDLGCGPGHFTTTLATLFPETQFIGIDASTEMLTHANHNREKAARDFGRRIENLSFRQAMIQDLGVSDKSIGGVTSTMAFHHLPDVNDLAKAFAEIERVLQPDGFLYIADLLRPKSLKSVESLVDLSYAPDRLGVLAVDYRNSLKAAFSLDELAHALKQTQLRPQLTSTFALDFIFELKLGQRGSLPKVVQDHLRKNVRNLPLSYRLDYRFIDAIFRKHAVIDF